MLLCSATPFVRRPTDAALSRSCSMPATRAFESIISLTEAAYDLAIREEAWLPRLLEMGAPLLDQGLGVAGLIATKSPRHTPGEIHEVHTAGAPPDFLDRHIEVARRLPREQIHRQTKTGLFSLSELTAEKPGQIELWRSYVGYARDALGVISLDIDGRGIQLIAPLPEVRRVGRAERAMFEMLAAHLSAGLRMRKALAVDSAKVSDGEAVHLPLGAEAVLEPSTLNVSHAGDNARDASSLSALRAAAVRFDRARGQLRKENPEEALEMWRALIRGRWSMVDWFDTDNRRYILALSNPPHITDPRGLTQRESHVVAYAALGHSHKIIGYRLGVSRVTVTHSLGSAMRKLGVKTQAQLVEQFHALVQATSQVASEATAYGD